MGMYNEMKEFEDNTYTVKSVATETDKGTSVTTSLNGTKNELFSVIASIFDEMEKKQGDVVAEFVAQYIVNKGIKDGI